MNDKDLIIGFVIDRVKKKMYATGDSRFVFSQKFKKDYKHVCSTLRGDVSCGLDSFLMYCDYIDLDILKAIKKEFLHGGTMGGSQTSYND